MSSAYHLRTLHKGQTWVLRYSLWAIPEAIGEILHPLVDLHKKSELGFFLANFARFLVHWDGKGLNLLHTTKQKGPF